MTTPEQELKRLLHFGRQIPFYQPGDRLMNGYYHFCVQTAIEKMLAEEKLSDAANCIVKAFSDGYSAHPAMLVYALAVCAKQVASEQLREATYKAMKTVCSSPENLFLFIKYAVKVSSPNNFIWGSGFRKVCKDWYLKKDPKTLAEMVARQKRCHGWSHKDIIKLIHLKAEEPARAAIVMYIMLGIKAAKKEFGENAEAVEVLNYLQAVEDFKHLTDEQQAARNIETHRFTLEHVPTHLIKSREVWSALVGNLPLATLLKSLQRMGYLGFLTPNSFLVSKVVDALNDESAIAESHLHPAQVYLALRNYEMSSRFLAAEKARMKLGKKAVKNPPKSNPKIVSALHDLFASTCKLFLAPTGLRYLVAIDLKRFASTDECYRCPHVSSAQAAVVTALCLLHADRNVSVRVAGTNDELVPVALTTAMTVQQGVKELEQSRMHSMKLSTPLDWALKKREERDVFVLITDSVHKGKNPTKALEKYREDMKIPNVKLVIVLLKCTFELNWVNDATDPGLFVIGGFDGNVPRLIEAFSRGAF